MPAIIPLNWLACPYLLTLLSLLKAGLNEEEHIYGNNLVELQPPNLMAPPPPNPRTDLQAEEDDEETETEEEEEEEEGTPVDAPPIAVVEPIPIETTLHVSSGEEEETDDEEEEEEEVAQEEVSSGPELSPDHSRDPSPAPARPPVFVAPVSCPAVP